MFSALRRVSLPKTRSRAFLSTSLSTLAEEVPIYLSLSSFLPKLLPKEQQDEVIALDPTVFNHSLRKDILFLCVNHYRDALRQGSASTKTRGDVAGSGRKIRPQKGTGMARLGDGQSPMLRGGGVAFGPKPRSFATDLPRKVRMMGMRVALSARLKEQMLGVARELDWPGAKTNHFARRIDHLKWNNTLFVTGGEPSARLERVTRNITNLDVMRAEELNVYEILRWPRLILDVGAVDYFERLLGKNVPEEQRIPMQPLPADLRFSRARAGQVGKHSPRIAKYDTARLSEDMLERRRRKSRMRKSALMYRKWDM